MSAPGPSVNTALFWNARGNVVETIKYLSEHDLAMVSPFSDWLMTLRQMLAEMRQYDGSACA